MKIKTYFLKYFTAALFAIVTTSCTSYLENPLKDKETGEDIDLLVIDPSVFPVRLKIYLVDSTLQAPVVSPATITFSGTNYNDIITLTGKKQSEFHTSGGFLELAVDPNVVASEAKPLSFTIHVKTKEYPETSSEIIIDSQGIKKIKLLL